MAEDISFRPKEATTNYDTGKLDRLDRFKVFLGDIFQPKDKTEHGESHNERSGRFIQAWRRMSSNGLVQTERVVPSYHSVDKLKNQPYESAPEQGSQNSLVRPETIRKAKEAQNRRSRTQELTLETAYPISNEVKMVVERLERGEVAELAYELSHEHKDADISSAASTAAHSATHTKTIASHHKSIPQASTHAVSNKKQQSADPFIRYQQAATKGFIVAVIIFAIVMVLLLLK